MAFITNIWGQNHSVVTAPVVRETQSGNEQWSVLDRFTFKGLSGRKR
jgi:hypothetical protein